jgi:chromosome segregation ATPase
MQKKCINCKREIEAKQKQCYLCGAEQSYFKRFSKNLLLLALILIAAGTLAKHYHQAALIKAEQQSQAAVSSQLEQLNSKIQSLEKSLTTSQQQLIDKQGKLSELEAQQSASASQTDQVSQALEQQLATTKASEKKQRDRASWLGRENVRLKAELEQLQQSIKQSQQQASSQVNSIQSAVLPVNQQAEQTSQAEQDGGQDATPPPND